MGEGHGAQVRNRDVSSTVIAGYGPEDFRLSLIFCLGALLSNVRANYSSVWSAPPSPPFSSAVFSEEGYPTYVSAVLPIFLF